MCFRHNMKCLPMWSGLSDSWRRLDLAIALLATRLGLQRIHCLRFLVRMTITGRHGYRGKSLINAQFLTPKHENSNCRLSPLGSHSSCIETRHCFFEPQLDLPITIAYRKILKSAGSKHGGLQSRLSQAQAWDSVPRIFVDTLTIVSPVGKLMVSVHRRSTMLQHCCCHSRTACNVPHI